MDRPTNNGDDEQMNEETRSLWCKDCGSMQKFMRHEDGNWWCTKCGTIMT
jgi:ribosomal protein L37AE/L43A